MGGPWRVPLLEVLLAVIGVRQRLFEPMAGPLQSQELFLICEKIIVLVSKKSLAGWRLFFDLPAEGTEVLPERHVRVAGPGRDVVVQVCLAPERCAHQHACRL